MAITMTAAEADRMRMRPPLNLAVVIDRSGSMHGEPLAQAKAAAQKLLSRLRPSDHFSVIAYGSEVEVMVRNTNASPDGLRSAEQAIESIYDDGGTNLSGGLLSGREQVLAAHGSGVARIVLISDGKANEGIVSPDELARLAEQTAEMGVSITTVGVGLDFDERVMTRIAVAGHGNYYFAERAGDLGDRFASEMDRIGATVATDAVLEVTPAPGVELLEVFGYPMGNAGRTVNIPIADLHAGEQRKVVLRLAVRSATPGSIDFADVRLRYTDIEARAAAESSIALSAIATSNSREVVEYRTAEANGLIQSALTARAIEQATELYESGHAAQAVLVMRARKSEAMQIARELDDKQLAGAMEEKSDEILRNLSDARAPESDSGRRVTKENRKGAYELYR
jgi:Ca-activated chloride channel family protein